MRAQNDATPGLEHGRALPTERFSFVTRLEAADPVVRDHHVHGVPILPGVTFLDLACRALAAIGVECAGLELRNVLFVEPLAVATPRALELHFEPGTGFSVSSREPGAVAARLHFRCELHAAAGAPPAREDLADLRARASRRRELDALYELARGAGIVHRDFMRCHGHVLSAPAFTLAQLELGAEALAYADHFWLHPTLMDSSTLAAFVGEELPATLAEPAIPLHIQCVRLHAALPSRVVVHVPHDGPPGAGGDVRHASYRLLGEQGDVLVEIEGLAVKRIRSASAITALHVANSETRAAVAVAHEHTAPEPARPAGVVAPGLSVDVAQLEAEIGTLVARVCGVAPAQLDSTRGFYDQGLDSAQLLALTRDLERHLGRPLYPTLLFEHPSIRELALYLAHDARPVEAPPVDDVHVWEARWQPADERVPHEPAPDGVLLAFTDAAEARGLLASAGWGDVVQVRVGADYQRVGPQEYALRPEVLSDYRRLLAELRTDGLFPRRVVHAWSPAEGELEGRLRLGLDSVFCLSRALSEERLSADLELLVGYGREVGQPSPAPEAALSGLARTLWQENPRLAWRTVEVECRARGAARAHEVLEALWHELGRAPEACELRYVAGRRERCAWEEWQATGPVAEGARRTGGVYLISGGAGGLGLLFAEHLGRSRAGRVLLLGRSAPSAALEQRLSALRGRGVEVEYLRGDVSVEADVRAAVAHAQARYGRLDGVLHAAGVLRDRLLRNKELSEVRAVVASKLLGAQQLDAATAGLDLEFFVTFGSSSGLLGNVGQSDYAYANAYLWWQAQERERLRQQGQRRGRSLCLAWPLWAAGGMQVEPAQQALLHERHGLVPLSTAQGLEAFERLLAAPGPSAALVLRAPRARCVTLLTATPRVSTAVVERPPATVPQAVQATTPRTAQAERSAIAIIGVAGRYPGAETLEEFWNNLRAGRDCIGDVPPERWEHARYYDPQRGRPGKTNSRWGGFLEHADAFDAPFFNIAPREAELMDPQERLFLEVAWETLEDAGYTRRTLRTSQVGVFVGAMWGQYELLRGTAREPEALPTSIFASIANRVSYFFDFQGPSLALDSMCSSSLTALHLACESLRSGACALALAGGVNLTPHPNKYVQLAQGQFTSSDGRCRSFGAGGDGYVPGEGVGAVLLKPLAQALADGDRIHGLVRASAIAHNGRSSGYTVPSPQAQAAVIRLALEQAGVEPASIGYVEAHGTGTALGDPIEIAGLVRAFGLTEATAPACALGSVKSNIGHLEAAAGVAALTKVLLQLRHRELVPSLHAEPPNPEIDFASTRFRVQRALAPWPAPTRPSGAQVETLPRRAGISSFGAGGANAHVIVEEHLPAASCVRDPGGPQIVLLSARNAERLRAYAACWNAWLEGLRNTAEPPSLAAIARTTQIGREAMEVRVAFVVADLDGLQRALRGFLAGQLTEGTFGPGASDAARPLLRGLLDDADGQAFLLDLLRQGKVAKLAQLWAAGAELDWSTLPAPSGWTRVALPTYPFARRRLWAGAALDLGARPVLAEAVQSVAPAPERAVEPTPAAAPPSGAGRLTLRSLRTDGPGRATQEARASASAPVPLRAAGAAVVTPQPGASPDMASAAPDARALVAASATRVPSGATPRPAQVLELVKRALADVLYLEPGELADDRAFVDLGMDSILAVELVKKLNAALGLELRATQLYDHPTIAELAAHLALASPAVPAGAQLARPVAATPAPPSAERAAGPAPGPRSVDLALGLAELEAELEAEAARSAPSAAPRPVAVTVAPPVPELAGPASDAIAIVGLAGRFPGADDAGSLWRNLRAGRCSVGEVPPERWSSAAHFDPEPGQPGKSYCKWGGFVSDVDCFDALFFNVSPAEAEALDPQQRLFLEEAWHALEDAGYAPATLAGMRCGVFAGVLSGSEYAPHIFNSSAMLAARIAYFLNLKGPAVAIDTACSSSLVALHLACRSLLAREVDMALAGGVALYLTELPFIGMSQAGMLSASGRCWAFDARADGFVPGEAAALVVLRRLEDALRANDRIYAVIKGSAVNQDGKTNGITAPSMKSQRELALEAYRVAAIEPRALSYVEAHGTGTRLGDPIEVAALSEAFRQSTDARGFCALGSVKANLGHTSAAAGVTGLIKVLLSLRHGELPPCVGLEQTNPEIDFANSPFLCNRERLPWPRRPGQPRLAAVSSFGYSGTNAHVVLAEPPLPAARAHAAAGPQLVVVSGRTPEARQRALENLRAWLLEPCDEERSLVDVAYTLLARRAHFGVRAACVVQDLDELRACLDAWLSSGHTERGVLGASAASGSDAGLTVAAQYLLTSVEAAGQDGPARAAGLSALAGLYVRGADLDATRLIPAGAARVASLPGYPFARERYWRTHAPSQAFAGPSPEAVGPVPRSSAEGAADLLGDLRAVFAQVLKLDEARIDPAAEFETYGLDSILIGQVNKQLTARFGPLPATLLFKYKTLASLAAHLATLAPVPATAMPTPAQTSAAERTAPAPERARTLDEGDIAIIGLSGRFPGARDLEQLWENLCSGRDSITEIPRERWDHGLYFDPHKGRPGKSYSKWGGFLEDVDQFDPQFFGIAPLEARFMDPQERLFLECAWSCLEDAGHTREALADPAAGDRRGDVGVFAGVTFNDYQLCGAAEWARGNPVPLNTQSFSIANRVSYLLNLRGPSLTVDTACSSSLFALHLACEALRRGDCALALAGGVNLSLHPSKYVTLAAQRMHSSDGRCRSFGAGGDGFVSAEGVAVVLLKPKAQALRDGDHIHALIKGSATNHDGRTHGYTVPNPVAQAEVIQAALRRAGVTSRSIGYVEAHGTGTALGDPIEVTGLTDAFALPADAGQCCALGSVKSNLGHLEAAAGMAQLAKVVLQLQHRTLVPSLHALPPNPEIDFAATPFRVQTSLAPWPRMQALVDGVPRELPRRAGISSFGAGGVNVHVIVEEAVPADEVEEPASAAVARLARVEAAVAALGCAQPSAERAAFQAFEDWCRLALLARVQALGLFVTTGETWLRSDIEATLALVPSQRRQFGVVLDVLARAGWVRLDGAYILPGPQLAEPGLRAQLAGLAERRVELSRAHPFLAAHAGLFEACLARYDEVLSGSLPAVQALFPGGSTHLVDGVYRGNAELDGRLAAGVAAGVAGVFAAQPGRRVRVLEIGAGTGGTTSYVLAALAADLEHVEYVYTDVSPALLAHGERQFGARGHLSFQALDIEQHPREQGLDVGGFDLIVAANVLHATRRIDDTLQHVRALLRPGGLLFVKEVMERVEFSALTFGLLEGWWRFEDDERRLPDSPLLAPAMWKAALEQAGFQPLAPWGGGSAEQVIVAQLVPSAAGPALLPLSAKNPRSLRAAAERLARHLARAEAASLRLDDVAFTLQTGREAMPERLALVVTSLAEAAEGLECFARGAIAGRARCYQGLAPRGLGRAAPATQDLERLAEAWVAGDTVDWRALHAQRQPRRVALPGYVFDRQAYWIGARDAQPAAGAPPVEAPAALTDRAELDAADGTALRARLRNAPRGEREELLVADLQARLGRLLGFVAPALPDPQQGFFDMGMDSIAALEFRQQITRTFGVELADTVVFQHPNLQDLARLLLTLWQEEPAQPARAQELPARAPAPALGRLGDELEAELQQAQALLTRS